MKVVIKILDVANKEIRIDSPEQDQWIQEYNPEANKGVGHFISTDHVDKAIKFNKPDEALVFIKQQPKCKPLRDDGLPNRPLMAFHLMLEFV